MKDVTKPVGQWNEGRIVAKGNHVEHWLNGVKVVEYELGSADWKAHVQASKFGKIPAYGTLKRGYIALQDHESVVVYRNLKIKEAYSDQPRRYSRFSRSLTLCEFVIFMFAPS